jgi:hypothetical protein
MRDESGGGGRGSGNGQLNNLFHLKEMRGGDACARRADIKGLGQFNEFDTQSICAPKEHRYLDTDAGILALLSECHRVLRLEKLARH